MLENTSCLFQNKYWILSLAEGSMWDFVVFYALLTIASHGQRWSAECLGKNLLRSNPDYIPGLSPPHLLCTTSNLNKSVCSEPSSPCLSIGLHAQHPGSLVLEMEISVQRSVPCAEYQSPGSIPCTAWFPQAPRVFPSTIGYDPKTKWKETKRNDQGCHLGSWERFLALRVTADIMVASCYLSKQIWPASKNLSLGHYAQQCKHFPLILCHTQQYLGALYSGDCQGLLKAKHMLQHCGLPLGPAGVFDPHAD